MAKNEDSENKQARLSAIVKGRVQGVGFRYFTQRHAVQYDLTGWVRNRRSGTVELVAEGTRQDLGRLLKAISRGPQAGTTQNVDYDWHQATGEFSNFRIRMTA